MGATQHLNVLLQNVTAQNVNFSEISLRAFFQIFCSTAKNPPDFMHVILYEILKTKLAFAKEVHLALFTNIDLQLLE